MNEASNHVVKLMQLSRRLQNEMARTYQPDFQAIVELCQEIENSTCAVYEWARGIESRQTEGEAG